MGFALHCSAVRQGERERLLSIVFVRLHAFLCFGTGRMDRAVVVVRQAVVVRRGEACEGSRGNVRNLCSREIGS